MNQKFLFRFLGTLGLAALLSCLPACNVKDAEKLGNATGFGGTDPVTQAFEAARASALTLFKAYRDNRFRESFGDLNYRGNSVAVENLLLGLADSDAKRTFVRDFLTPERVNNYISALENWVVESTDNPAKTTRNGRVENALTEGNHTYVFVPRYLGIAKRGDYLTDTVHEIGHTPLFNFPDEGDIGPFQYKDFLSTIGAAAVAYDNFLNDNRIVNGADAGSGRQIFFDGFRRANSTTLGSDWNIVTGSLVLSNQFATTPTPIVGHGFATAAGFETKDVVVSAYINLTVQNSWIHMAARSTEQAEYVVGLGRVNGTINPGIWKFIASNPPSTQWEPLCGVLIDATNPETHQGMLKLEIQGNRLTAYYRGQKNCEIVDTTPVLQVKGKVGIRISQGFVKDFLAQEL